MVDEPMERRRSILPTILSSFDYATRLSAGGVTDESVTQLLRQGDAMVQEVFADETPDEARGAAEAEPTGK